MKPRTLRAVTFGTFGTFGTLAPLVGIVLVHMAACSSNSNLTPTYVPPGADSGVGGGGDASDDTYIPPYDAQGTPLVKCGTMTCPRGDICVAGTSDAGPDFHCKGFPAACAGDLSCTCASALCPPGESCDTADASVLTCAAP